MTWTANHEDHGGGTLWVAFSRDSRRASFADVMDAWRNDADFRKQFNAVLADAPFTAFRWEPPPVTAGTLSRPFECVLLDSPGLARPPAPESFAEYFAHDQRPVVSFGNLGGDAVLVAPRPVGDLWAYGHIAAFVRGRAGGSATRALARGRRRNGTPRWRRAGVAEHRRGRRLLAVRPARRPTEVLRL